MANALYALDAVVRVRGAGGRERTIPVDEFHRLPGDTPEKDNNLAARRAHRGHRAAEVELREELLLPEGPRPRLVTPSRSSRSPPRWSSTATTSGRRASCSGAWRTSRGGAARRRPRSSGKPASEESFRRAAEAALEGREAARAQRLQGRAGEARDRARADAREQLA